MRCSEARSRLARLVDRRIDPADDSALAAHLAGCASCARDAEAARGLADAFRAAEQHDLTDDAPLHEIRRRVEARVESPRTKERRIMRILSRELSRRPRLGVSLAVTAVILLIATLVPFRIDRTVGYELAVAGVSKDVARHSDQLFELLHRLGVDGAEIEVVGCDTTCNLKISRLATADDMDLVRAAFGEIGKDRVEFFVQPVTVKANGSLFDVALQRIEFVGAGSKDSTQVRKIVEERLGNEITRYEFVFFGDDSTISTGTNVSMMLDRMPSGSEGSVFISDDSTAELRFEWIGDSTHLEEAVKFVIDDGELPEDVARQLQERGIVIEWQEDGEGNKSGELFNMGETPPFGEADSAAAKAGELPEGYSVSQNYPNPFNPTTSIDYSLPTSQHVTIEVFNINGRKVKTLVDQVVAAGSHTVMWDATSDDGLRVASGVYLYRFVAGNIVRANKMTLLK